MFEDKDGGNITTVHNFKKGIVAHDEDAVRHGAYVRALNDPIDATDYRKGMSGERDAVFERDEPIIDDYTGRELPKDGRTHRDHVMSIKSIEQAPEGHLAQTREERVRMANVEENKAWTSNSINSSKQHKSATEWAEQTNTKDKMNAEYYGVDQERLKQKEREVGQAIKREQKKAVRRKQSKELMHAGVRDASRLALRQVIGLFLKDIAEGIIADIRHIIRQGSRSLGEFTELIKNRVSETVETIRNKWKQYLQAGVEGGVSGFISNFVTLLINGLWSTARNIVTIIREGTMSLIRAFRIIVSPPPHMSKSEVVYEVFKILGGALVVAIGIGLEETIKKGLAMIPPLLPYAHILASVITGLITGVASLLVMMAFDKLKAYIRFKNKEMADVHRGQSIVLVQIKRTVLIVDEAARYSHAVATHLRDEIQRDKQDMIESGRTTDEAIEDYSSAVDRMNLLLEGSS